MAGWVDLHVHYLPGIDDGPATFEGTLAMLRRAHDSGTRMMVATPHLYSFVAEALRPADVRRAFAETRAALTAAARRPEHAFLGEMSFYEGAENHLGPELLEDAFRKRAVTLHRTRQLLVELPPFMGFDSARRALERIVELGYVPVLAHVERYPMLLEDPGRLRRLLASGCVAQVNASSVGGGAGRRATRQVLALLEEGLVGVIASDGHDATERPPDLGRAASALGSKVPEARIFEWLREMPGRLLGINRRPAGGPPSRR